MKRITQRMTALLLALALFAVGIAGCGSADTTQTEAETAVETEEETEEESQEEEAEAVENEPIDPDDIAITVGDVSVLGAEMFYYYLALRLQYESYYDIDWESELYDDYTYGDYLKYLVESQILQNIFWNSLAEEAGVTLTEDDYEEIAEDLESFNSTITDADKEFYGFTDETVTATLEHLAIAGKVLDVCVAEEIENFTDEEIASCTYMTVQHILLCTTSEEETDEDGDYLTADAVEEYNAAQLELAEEILAMALAGEDFETLADTYNEDSGFEYTLNSSGESPDGVTYVDAFTEGCWALSAGEIAIVETEYGYHVVKCITENDEEYFEEAEEDLALDKYSDIYADWLDEIDATFYDGWANFVVTNDDALTESTEDDTEDSTEDEEES